MKKKIIIAVVVIVILIIASILGVIIINKIQERNEEKEAEQKQYEEELKIKDEYTSKADEFELSIYSDKKDVYMGDYKIIGVIEIPKISLKSPILERTEPETVKMAVTSMYSTEGINEPGSSVLYGKNFQNSLLFSRLDELKKGDEIVVTNANASKKAYVVESAEIVPSNDTSYFYPKFSELTKGQRELYLITPTDDAKETDNIYKVYCVEKEKSKGSAEERIKQTDTGSYADDAAMDRE